jgi:DNA polymerase III alpha subunit
MCGVIPFYAAAKKVGIKPIIGLEAYISPRGMPQKEGKLDADTTHDPPRLWIPRSVRDSGERPKG